MSLINGNVAINQDSSIYYVVIDTPTFSLLEEKYYDLNLRKNFTVESLPTP